MKWSYEYIESINSHAIKQDGRVKLYADIEDNAICICNALNCDSESEIYIKYNTNKEDKLF